jgi:hypothetical protein
MHTTGASVTVEERGPRGQRNEIEHCWLVLSVDMSYICTLHRKFGSFSEGRLSASWKIPLIIAEVDEPTRIAWGGTGERDVYQCY